MLQDWICLNSWGENPIIFLSISVGIYTYYVLLGKTTSLIQVGPCGAEIRGPCLIMGEEESIVQTN